MALTGGERRRTKAEGLKVTVSYRGGTISNIQWPHIQHTDDYKQEREESAPGWMTL